MGKLVKKIPPSETGPNMTYLTESGKTYQITRNPRKSQFTLWLETGDGYEKIRTASSPYDFYDGLT